MSLDLSNLEKSIKALERVLNVVHNTADMEKLSAAQVEAIRGGVIQSFEVCYELCWKFIQRWIRINRTPEDADHTITRKELFRMAARYGLIEDPIPWFSYGEARNITSHAYNEENAEEVFKKAKPFAGDAGYLFKRLQEKND